MPWHLLALAAAATAAASAPPTWTTLGTAGGPALSPERSQPANLLAFGERHWVVDCGDGCAERVAAAGITPIQVDAVFISHLHQDHVAGLGGLLGLRWMQRPLTPVTIYGPPGIEVVVDGILRGLGPSERIGVPGGGPAMAAAQMVKVVTLRDGADMAIDGVRLRAIRNTHFDEQGTRPDNGTQSLSFRFDGGGMSVGYTGDTGPDPALAGFFAGVALLVSETADLASAAAAINAPNSQVPPAARAGLIRHIADHHVTPEQAGALARAAGARCLVLTHLSITGPTQSAAARLAGQALTTAGDAVAVAHDLDRFSASDASQASRRCRPE